MPEKIISFAAVFTKNGGTDPLCSICFFVRLRSPDDQDAAASYLAQTVIPQIAQKIPNSDPDAVSHTMEHCLVRMERELGVCCQGFLTDYNLSICRKS